MSRKKISAGLVALALLTTTPGWAKKKVENDPFRTQAPKEEASVLQQGMRMSLETGVPLAVYRTTYRPEGQTALDQAQNYLKAHQELFRLRQSDLSDLYLHAIRTGGAGDTVRLRQNYQGVPVYKAELTVTITPDGVIGHVANTYKPVLEEIDVNPVLDTVDAKAAATAWLRPDAISWEKQELVVHHFEGQTRLSYLVWMEPQTDPVGSWKVFVDAKTGEVYHAEDASHYVDGTGNVFDPDPLTRAGATYGDPGFVDGGDANTPQLIAAQSSVTLLDIQEVGSDYTLIGPHAEIVDFEGPFNGIFTQTSDTSWDFDRFDDDFEAANVYYQIDQHMRYLNITLGLGITPYQYPGGAQFDPHGLNGADNSHYLSGSGRVSFGEGGVDDSEDADVIIHELGHGLHDWVTSGGLSQVNGLSEGIGDFQANSYSRSTGLLTDADPEWYWVFKWDGHNPFWSGRITNYGAVYPGGLVGQVHTDGQIWATCMMKVWDAIGRDATERAHWEGIATTGSGTNQQDAAQAVADAAVSLGYDPGQLTAMETQLESCGYIITITIPLDPIFDDGFESGDTSAWSNAQP